MRQLVDRRVISTLKHRVAIDTMEHQAATTLAANEIGCVNPPPRPAAESARPYRDNRELGSFILRPAAANGYWGRRTNDRFLARAAHTNIRWQTLKLPSSGRRD